MALLGKAVQPFSGDENNSEAARVVTGAFEFAASVSAAYAINRAFAQGPEQSWSLVPAEASVPGSVAVGADTPPERFEPQYSMNVVRGSGFMGFEPGTVPVSSAPLSFDVEHLFGSEHRDDDLSPIVRVFERMQRKLKATRLPPRMRVRYGPWDETVWMANAIFQTGPFWQGTALPTWLRVRFTLVVTKTPAVERANITRPRETTWHTLADGETYEWLAGLYWRDPSRSTTLRRINGTLEESPGMSVKILDLTHPTVREDPYSAPQAPCFITGMERVQEIALERIGWASGSWTGIGDLAEADDSATMLYEAP